MNTAPEHDRRHTPDPTTHDFALCTQFMTTTYDLDLETTTYEHNPETTTYEHNLRPRLMTAKYDHNVRPQHMTTTYDHDL